MRSAVAYQHDVVLSGPTTPPFLLEDFFRVTTETTESIRREDKMQALVILILPLLLAASLEAFQLTFVAGPQSTKCCSTGRNMIIGNCRLGAMSRDECSHIVSITSRNIAGMKNDDNTDEITVRFASLDDTAAGFVAVTGESGSGKSLLVSKAIDLVTGGKVVASLLPSSAGDGGESETVVDLGE